MHVLTTPSGVDNKNAVERIVPAVASGAPGRHASWLALLLLAGATQAAQVVIHGPVGSGEFGLRVTTLPNGNIVVTDPFFDAPGPIADVGAVYLYRPDGTLMSTLRGSTANDRLGDGGVVVLANGNFVVRSPNWDNGAIANVGAVTFASGTSGITGLVSPTNSLVGGSANDGVGGSGVTALTNGNYVVVSISWDNGAIANVGAVTFGSGTSGISGVVSPANSLVGSTMSDVVGFTGVTALSNGNYVVISSAWDNGATVDVGAVTFGSGASGVSGVVSPANSLVGVTAGDRVGGFGVAALTNGSYVVRSPDWNNGATADAGAVTFGSGTTGITGVVSPANSLVGSSAFDRVGAIAVTVLTNGNYVLSSPNWDNGATVDAGAVTFGSGTSGIAGVISSANSLVGSTASDQVGHASLGASGVIALTNGNYVVISTLWDNEMVANAGAVTFSSGTNGVTGAVSQANSLIGGESGDSVGSAGVTALSNGNYVVSSPFWNNGAKFNVGAVTFGSGTSGIVGVVLPTNSLVGSAFDDRVGGSGISALANGNYVVQSADWDNGSTVDAGAVTFGSGTSGITGAVSVANSLVGSMATDAVGAYGVIALTNGNYVVRSAFWNNGATANVGAVTFGLGIGGVTGVVSPANSLIGTAVGDYVGFGGLALSDGNYLVRSPDWNNGSALNAGALTFGSGTSGITGVVSPFNSLVGSVQGDQVGESDVVALSNGHYVVRSPDWDNAGITNAGAITLGLSNGSVVGAITSEHSVLGTVAGQGSTHTFSYDATRNQLAVGQPASNRVVLHRTGIGTAISIVSGTPDPSNGGEPVTFTATTTAAPNAPNDGKVTFTANTGETCVDTTPTATSATTADWSCTLTFTANGVSAVIAEYTGSIIHAYSGSAPETHTTIVEPPLFANGFEGP